MSYPTAHDLQHRLSAVRRRDALACLKIARDHRLTALAATRPDDAAFYRARAREALVAARRSDSEARAAGLALH